MGNGAGEEEKTRRKGEKEPEERRRGLKEP